jgi:hypothetical protein
MPKVEEQSSKTKQWRSDVADMWCVVCTNRVNGMRRAKLTALWRGSCRPQSIHLPTTPRPCHTQSRTIVRAFPTVVSPRVIQEPPRRTTTNSHSPSGGYLHSPLSTFTPPSSSDRIRHSNASKSPRKGNRIRLDLYEPNTLFLPHPPSTSKAYKQRLYTRRTTVAVDGGGATRIRRRRPRRKAGVSFERQPRDD